MTVIIGTWAIFPQLREIRLTIELDAIHYLYIMCVNLLFSCCKYHQRWALVCADEDLQIFVLHLWARESGNFDLRTVSVV